MAVPRAKKPKKSKPAKNVKYTDKDLERRVTSMEEIYKAIMYLYLVETKKWKKEELIKLDKHFAKMILALYSDNLNYEELFELLKKHEVDLNEIGANTQKWIDTYGEAWGLGKAEEKRRY